MRELAGKSLRASALIVALVLAGCFPAPEQAGELTRVSMQEHFRKDPRFKDKGIEVIAVRVTGGEDRQLEAVASVAHAGKTYEVPVTIILDGVNLEWFADPSALRLLAPAQPIDQQPPPR